MKGKEYRPEANTNPSDPRADEGLSVGQSVEVRYDPADPERARLLTRGASEFGILRFMTLFGLSLFGLPTALLLVKRVFKPQGPLPEISVRAAYPEGAGGRIALHDAHRLPEGGVVLVPSPMVPIALVSGLGLLAVSLLVMVTVDDDPRTSLARCALLFAAWPPLLTLVYFGSSHSLRAGPGWLATKRGWRWHVIHTEGLADVPSANELDALFGQGRILRLYSASTRIDIGEQQLACPEVHSAVEAFAVQAPGISQETRFAVLRLINELGTDPSKDPRTPLLRMWMFSCLLVAICLVEAVLLLARSS